MSEKLFTEEQLFADLEKDGSTLDAEIINNAKKGNGEALWSIGYEYDIELKQYTKALAWYLLGANRNHAHALNNIGMLYHNGQGVAKSYLDALEWWIKSAKQNNVLSMLNIGNLFNNGQGVPLDTNKAQQWYHINDASVDKDKLMKRLIKETEDILNAERKKIQLQPDHLSKPPRNDSNNTGLPEERKQSHYKEYLAVKQQKKSLKALEQTIEQGKQSMLNEIDQLKQSNQSLRERLRSKENTIKSLKEELKTSKIQQEPQDAKEMKKLFKRLVCSQHNEIKLIKQNMELLLKQEKHSKRKLKKKLKMYKERS